MKDKDGTLLTGDDEVKDRWLGRWRKLEWFGDVKRRDETENIQAVAEIKMEVKRPRGRPKLRWYDTVRRDLKAWKIKEEWATDQEKWKCLCKTRYREQGDGGER